MHLQPGSDAPDWNIEAPVELRAVRSERIDLTGRVGSSPKAVSGSAIRVRPHDDDVAVERCPFALHAVEPISEIEDEVVPLAITQRSVHADPARNCSFRDGELGYRALLIRR